ncbi:MJ0042-type zinc finger domain-containing protein [Pseudemcibacter aquimaris]|uniref:MJ0042-type zinc finger domain-containing protein n=1 Tax=Pseudemcibacter aquimaris TaxID=2857064 RepID=UPI00201174D9|nr:MJ0042-type zinc finger domain-containing protein [Pseudemcibacter aquimaris]MCC3861619.1 zinc-ribbon domain-containing protein [Pseudemcibacter aquimaris]WDU58388.1 zinc-ribbon domain-containing protein [Pseudemcibacter aquimaris]
MILTCPECKARYVVSPQALMPRGRTVRCAKCKHSWFEDKPKDDLEIAPTEEIKIETPPAEEPADDAADNETAKSEGQGTPDDVTEDFDFPISQPKKRKRPIPKGSNLPALQNQNKGSGKLGWISLVIFITAIISLFLVFQDSISEKWPASKRLYAAIGLDSSVKPVKPPAEEEIEDQEPIEDRLKIGPLQPRFERIGGVQNLVIAGYVENISGKPEEIPELRVRLLNERKQILRNWTFKANALTVNADEQVTFETSLPNSPADARDISVTFATN